MCGSKSYNSTQITIWSAISFPVRRFNETASYGAKLMTTIDTKISQLFRLCDVFRFWIVSTDNCTRWQRSTNRKQAEIDAVRQMLNSLTIRNRTAELDIDFGSKFIQLTKLLHLSTREPQIVYQPADVHGTYVNALNVFILGKFSSKLIYKYKIFDKV